MNSKEAIIDKILNDASEVAKANLSDAKAKADDIVSKARAEVEESKAKSFATLDDIKSTLVERRKTVANLDAKKAILTRKSELIDDIFNKSVDRVVADKGYKDLVYTMLVDYAEDGDEVMINARDKAIIDKALVDKVAKAKGIKLSLAKDFGKFGGGVMLIGKNVDKNLTVDAELKEMREEIEQEVAKILFGE